MSGYATSGDTSGLAGVVSLPRLLALGGGAVLTTTYLSVLYDVVDVVGGVVDTDGYLLVVAGSLVLAVVCARAFGPRLAFGFGSLLLAAGLVGYLLAVPGITVDVDSQLADTVSLLSGLSVLRVTRADVWALGLTPGPVFLSWYFFARRAYAPGVLVGGAALALFALTGDVATLPALAGVLGGVAAVGFGQLDREGSLPALRNGIVVVLVAMLVVTTSASLVPGGEARPLLADGGAATVETSLTGTDARVDLQGSIALSPTVRFSVTAREPRYWRVGAYDRYTGGGWVRTGGERSYDGRLGLPESRDVRPLRQTFEARSRVSTMPAAWKPIEVEQAPGPVGVTDFDGLIPRGGFVDGERYTVVSLVPDRSPRGLRRAGTDYPESIEARYLDLPESTPDRLGRFTSNLTADADSPYEKAATIEAWLEANKAYSLSVERPAGDVASAFVFEMDAGYCTYYATAMVAMLRTQGIPARFAVGYLPGERAGEDEWLVRGLDSHAWVEVYVEDVGWVQFDPTPAAPRRDAERDALDVARAAGEPNVDLNDSVTETETPETQTTEAGSTPDSADGTETPAGPNESVAPQAPSGPPFWASEAIPVAESGGGPSTETLLYGLVLVLGATTAAFRLGLVRRCYRLLWVRWLPAGPPKARVEAAVERGEYLLGRAYRPRRVGETRRAYVEGLADDGATGGEVDERAVALFRLGERARYAGRATDGDAAEAARLLGSLRTKFGRIG